MKLSRGLWEVTETLDECVIQDRNNLIDLHIMF